MAAAEPVYSPTTVSETKSKKWLIVPTDNLDKVRCLIKVVEVLLSFVAFILEEVVTNCKCMLYRTVCVRILVFPFKCMLVYITMLTCLLQDFVYTALMAVFFLIASIVFASDNGGTDLENAAVAFGFLATVAFLVDAGWFVKTRGFPFKKTNQQAASNGGAPVAEAEKLNREQNEAD
uniref:CKLF-like MARVEL transmembrane domain-containing protein 6 n=1 Tax=Oncorhynchus gorbuscha TaxID=8017 RepID=UPI001EAF2FC7|nr:CKLF-like MARVEL transmembrane domain-containing protein 6 [Oncorhynchus gorbuscha]